MKAIKHDNYTEFLMDDGSHIEVWHDPIFDSISINGEVIMTADPHEQTH